MDGAAPKYVPIEMDADWEIQICPLSLSLPQVHDLIKLSTTRFTVISFVCFTGTAPLADEWWLKMMDIYTHFNKRWQFTVQRRICPCHQFGWYAAPAPLLYLLLGLYIVQFNSFSLFRSRNRDSHTRQNDPLVINSLSLPGLYLSVVLL